MDKVKQIKLDGKSLLFSKAGMFHKTFASDFRQIRYYTLLIVQKAPVSSRKSISWSSR